MLQAANNDHFNPLDSKTHNSEWQDLQFTISSHYKSAKVIFQVFLFFAPSAL